MPTLKEKLATMTSNQHQLSVWMYLVQHIDETLARSDTKGPSMELTAEDCVEPLVSQEAIEAVRMEVMESFIGPLEETIDQTLSTEVE